MEQDEKILRNLAVDYLLTTHPFGDEKVSDVPLVDPEKALKQCLRKNKSVNRKRLADLILGSTVMKLRHLYVLFGDSFDGTALDRQKVRSVVDLHAEYLPDNDEFSNGIQWPSHPADELSVKYSLPLFLSKLMVDQYGIIESKLIADKANSPGPVTLRRNSLKVATDDELIGLLKNIDDVICDSINSVCGCLKVLPHSGDKKKKSIWSMQTWKDGLFEVQDMGSQLIVKAACACPGDVAVDYCTGNGGKALSLGSAIMSKDCEKPGHIYAHDVNLMRVKQLLGSLERAGLEESTITAICDGTSDDADAGRLEQNSKILNEFPNGLQADLVLVDAPCSSTGVLRRRPSQRWLIEEEKVLVDLPKLQMEILESASKYVKKGGRLVYATCSILSSENQDVARKFESLNDYHDCWETWDFDPEWDNVGEYAGQQNWRAILPHKHGCDGFFIARWKRKN